VTARPLSRAVALGWGGAALAAIALLPFLAELVARLPSCALRAAFALPCPACGSGRALVALAQGELTAALRWNPLAALGAPLFVLGGALASVRELAGRPLREPLEITLSLRLVLLALLAGQWAFLLWAGR
jgi:hypothetical protein